MSDHVADRELSGGDVPEDGRAAGGLPRPAAWRSALERDVDLRGLKGLPTDHLDGGVGPCDSGGRDPAGLVPDHRQPKPAVLLPKQRLAPSAPEPTAPPGRWIALGVLVLAVLLVALDSTVLGLAVPFLSEDMHPTGTQLLWIGDVYAFVLAGLLVTMGSLGDRMGRKKLLLGGAAAFGIISALAAFAPNAATMIAARSAMGVAGAALMPSTLALIRNLFPDPKERTVAVGIWGAMTSAGSAVGPILGGFLLEHFWWGSVFLINLPVMAVLLVVGAKLLPESRNPNPGPWDPLSVGLSLVGMLGIVYAMKETAAYGLRWEAGLAFAVGALALVWFGRRQLRLPAPLLDMRLFRDRAFGGAVLSNLVTVLGLAGLVFFMSQFLQLVQGASPLVAGLDQLPAAVGTVAAGLSAGLLARRWPVRGLVCGGLTAIGVALTGVVVFGPQAPYPVLAAVLLVCGAGAGLAYTTASDVILTRSPKENAGAASAVSETAYELGAALGIALLGSVVTGIYKGFRVPAGVSSDVARRARDSLGGAQSAASRLPSAQAHQLLDSAHQAFVSGLRVAAGGSAVLLLGAAGAAWWMLRAAQPVR